MTPDKETLQKIEAEAEEKYKRIVHTARRQSQIAGYIAGRTASIEREKELEEEIKVLNKKYDENAKERNQRIKELEDGLKEIADGKGAYSPDRLTHCANTVEAMKEIAKQLLTK